MPVDWGWAFDGVNTTIPRNAGPDCSQYLSWQRQIIECITVSSISAFILRWTWKRLNPCPDPNEEVLQSLTAGKRTKGMKKQQQQLERNSGYFGNNILASPLLPSSESDKNNVLLFHNDVTTDYECDKNAIGCHVQFSVNSNNYYGIHSGHQAGNRVYNNSPPPGVVQPHLNNHHHHHHQHGESASRNGLDQDGCSSSNVIVMCDNIYVGKQVLLVLMTFVLGLELGFKFASRTVIYLLNPCHITTIMQIYLLAAKPSKFATAVFRIQMNYLNGPTLAFLFPETDSRKIPIEAILYWVQHGLMFINSIYLLRLRHAETGVSQYSVQPLFDWSWNVFSYAILMIYHFAFLVSLAIPSEVNLNHMLCPAILDPFNGPNYRLIAVTHQAILCPLMCKTICWAFAPAEKPQQKDSPKRHFNEATNNDTESSLIVSSESSPSNGALGVPSLTSSVGSSPSQEHPIESLNRTDYLNLVNDSEEDEGEKQRLISFEGDQQGTATTATPVKRSAGVSGCNIGEEVVFSANVADKTFAGFLDKKLE